MITTVGDLLRELKGKPADAFVQFQVGVSNEGPIVVNGVQRVDNYGYAVKIVIGRG